MKGAVAAKILAAEANLDSEDVGEVVLAFVVGEESTGFGTKALVKCGVDADAVVLTEPTDLQPCVAQKGTVRYDVTVRGEEVTPADDKGVNAIDGMWRALNRLPEFDRAIREVEHPLLTPGSVTVTQIDGGIAHNVVPDAATTTVNCRILPGSNETPASFDRKMDRHLLDVFE
jgi:acetylornithine deacetylase/succinyl-diaminopimelate desuccinylase-like protein